MKENITIQIFDTYGIIHHNNIAKTVKLENIIKSFSSVNMGIESPILPNNCIKFKEKGNSTCIILYYEPTTFTAHLSNGSVYENVSRPGIIMKFDLGKNTVTNQYNIQNTNCYGVKDPYIALNDNTRLYGLPYPNISSSGGICWGSNSIGGNFTSLVGLKSYIDRLFTSPFNNHLYNHTFLRSVANIDGHIELFKFLQDKPHFPIEIFENLGTDFTLGKL